jgi:hypothetical protein
VSSDEKPCELCHKTITRNRRHETKIRFQLRRYCGNECRSRALRMPKGTATRRVASAPPEPVLRVEAGVWRPNAPGWPASPGGAA